MAVIHQATISPTKVELVQTWLDGQDWAPAGATELIGGYRFDDPAGEVGIEGLLARRGDDVVQVALTYRGAPLPGADRRLVSTMTHSALGDRWIYLAEGDPVGREVLSAALAGTLHQAALEYHHTDGTVEQREPAVTITRRGPQEGSGDLRFARVLGESLEGPRQLVATWAGGSGPVVAG